jgi:hypothetical protein
VTIGDRTRANISLRQGATQFVAIEAKLFSPFSSGTRRAPDFDQAARTVACMAEVISRAGAPLTSLSSLAFLVLAPGSEIQARVFSPLLSQDSIRKKVCQRIEPYDLSEKAKKEKWFKTWFEPTLDRIRIDCIPWEDILLHIRSRDETFGVDLLDYYEECLKFNRSRERDLLS